jgi:zinc/manganese transport system substrate-binding protein
MVFSNTDKIGTAQGLQQRLMRLIFGWYRCSLFLCFGALVASCAIGPVVALGQTADKIKVVASTSDLGALAAEVGGDRIQVEYLVAGNQEPHFAEVKPSYLLKLQHADLLIVVGLLSEGHWLTEASRQRPSLLSQSGNPRIQPGASGYFDASHYVQILEIPKPPVIPNTQPLGNPYYWLDPENGRIIAQALARKLSEISPQDASYFEDRFQAFSKRLSEAESGWDAEMKPYRGSSVATYQRSWSYLLKRFQLASVGEIEPQPGIPPNHSHTTELIDQMKSENVKVILVEPYFELNTPHAIARETGAKVVIMPSSVGGAKGVDDYFQLLDHDLALLSRAFQSQP